MKDPRTITIVVMNVVLATLVLILVWGVAEEWLREFLGRIKRRHAAIRNLDREMKTWFGGHGPRVG